MKMCSTKNFIFMQIKYISILYEDSFLKNRHQVSQKCPIVFIRDEICLKNLAFFYFFFLPYVLTKKDK